MELGQVTGREQPWQGPRYYVYAVGFYGPKQIAECEGDSLAFCLTTLREEGQIDDHRRIGILMRHDPDEPGQWLINPWAKGLPT